VYCTVSLYNGKIVPMILTLMEDPSLTDKSPGKIKKLVLRIVVLDNELDLSSLGQIKDQNINIEPPFSIASGEAYLLFNGFNSNNK